MKRIKHEVEQNSKEWFDARLGKFTSSQIHRLMSNPESKTGLLSSTAFKYCEAKAAELFYNEDVSDFKGNGATEWGHINEPFARYAYEQIEGVETFEGCFWTYGDNGSSPDFIVSSKKIGEIKNFYSKVQYTRALRLIKDEAGLKEFSKNYFYQTQHQMYTTGAESLDFVIYDDRLANKVDEGQASKCYRKITMKPIHEVLMEFEKRIPIAMEVAHDLLKQIIG